MEDVRGCKFCGTPKSDCVEACCTGCGNLVNHQAHEDVLTEFLRESNAVEDVWDEQSLYDAKLAWKYISEFKRLSEENILHTHYLLMNNHLGFGERGHYRTVFVYVGDSEGAQPKDIKKLMDAWIAKAANPKADAKKMHVEFEKIHPFIDGNGRTGRILYNWMLLKQRKPIHVIKNKEKWQYYEWFQ